MLENKFRNVSGHFFWVVDRGNALLEFLSSCQSRISSVSRHQTTKLFLLCFQEGLDRSKPWNKIKHGQGNSFIYPYLFDDSKKSENDDGEEKKSSRQEKKKQFPIGGEQLRWMVAGIFRGWKHTAHATCVVVGTMMGDYGKNDQWYKI